MIKRKKVIHLRQNCIGCNACVENAPGNWKINPEDGKADLARSVEKDGVFIAEIADPEVEDNQTAAQYCPVGIIKIIDEQGKDISNG